MAGAEYNGPKRDGFMPLHNVIEFFKEYVSRFLLPVKDNTTVNEIAVAADGRYLIKTTEANYVAKNVVIATGFF